MIPTVGSVFAFLLLVAPGLLYQRTRERLRPALRETAFREAGNVALASVAIHLVAGWTIFLATLGIEEFDVGRWIREGHRYFAEQWLTLLLLGGLELLLACMIAFGAAGYLALRDPSGPRLRRGPLWFRTFREEAPPDTNVFVQVTLDSGMEYWGQVSNYTSEDVPMEERELELATPILVRLPGESDARRLPAGVSRVLLPGGSIRGIVVTYLQQPAESRLTEVR